MHVRSLIASLLLCLAAGLCNAKQAASLGPELESVVIMRVDGSLVLDPKGGVVNYSVSTKVTDELRGMLELAIGKWAFEPVLIDGVPREIRTEMRVMLAARPVEGGFRIDVDNVLFPGTEGVLADDAKAVEGSMSGRKLSPPYYPQELAVANVRGTVLLAIMISAEGKAEEVAVTQSMLVDVRGQPRLMKQALRAFEVASVFAAKGWSFNITPERARMPGADRTVIVPVVFGGSDRKPGEVEVDGKWHTFIRGPKRPISWQQQDEGAQHIGVSDVAQGEVIPLTSAVALKSNVVGAPLL